MQDCAKLLREDFSGELFVLIVILLEVDVNVYRPFCKYLCPLGAIYGLFNPISSYRLVIDKDEVYILWSVPSCRWYGYHDL